MASTTRFQTAKKVAMVSYSGGVYTFRESPSFFLALWFAFLRVVTVGIWVPPVTYYQVVPDTLLTGSVTRANLKR